MEITDRATVLRDGHVAGTLVTPGSTKDDFVEMIVGRRLEARTFVAPPPATRAPSVRVRGLGGEVVKDLSFELAAGEVLGLTGLVGSGYDEVPYLLFGARPAAKGEMTLAGTTVPLERMTPGTAIARGIALIPGDRPNAGAIGALPVSDNVTMTLLGRTFNALMLDRGGMVRRAAQIAEAYTVQPRDPRLPLSALSGGNQQKVLLGKWLQLDPRLLLLYEPTQGVDVGARQNVFQHIAEAAAGGACVICASSDYEQLEAICTRVLVMTQGRITAELVRPSITKQAIAEHCYAGSPHRGVHEGDGMGRPC
jgi:ribose transport system ATP-binding protein